ncbi:hypothetical protein TSOC_002637 [Tetrabaena socialis]|uniref:Uncharacterized protein n=1 Tax=Tetrabaena socialis TaxID=47790 RepID=A0A2J8ADL6_9CHLO|nr:hypothetical protein TSOC_002637 [Tetrabaena socialis]|eukprot:PNH10599.1 hypothetical protein TSOC_002637 [Tetrabaena socialis]
MASSMHRTATTPPAARPVAVQCILERFFSPQALQCGRAAAELALNGGGGQAPLVLPSHLALAVLSSPHPDCAAALGVLHHGGLRLRCCEQLLLAAGEAEAARAGARGTSSSPPQDGVFSPAAQHFLFQSYRWAVYTGHSSVLPCHLLWALSADPRVAYSRDRRDPLDPAVRPWQDWRPPLVGLLEEAAGLKLLERPAPLYEQLLGVLQRAISAAPIQGPTAAASKSDPAASTSPAVLKASQLHQALTDRLSRVCSNSGSNTRMGKVSSMVLGCRAAGLVLSREQLQAIDQRMQNYLSSRGGYISTQDAELCCQYVTGVAALGHKSKVISTASSQLTFTPPRPPLRSALPYVDGPAAPHDPTVEVACQLAAALRFLGVDGARYGSFSWLRCGGSSQPLAQQVDELLLLSDTLAATDPHGGSSSSSHTLHSLLAGRAATLVGALGGTNEPTARAAVAAYASAAATVTAAKLRLLPWPTDGVVPPWLEKLTLQQRVRLLDRLAHVSQAALRASAVDTTAALQTAAAAVNQGSASVHASLELQRQAAVALEATGQPLTKGWLRQLASYGAVASKPASDALLAVLGALASQAAAPASVPAPPQDLLAPLSELLRANAPQPHMAPNEAVQALQNLRGLCKAGGEATAGLEDTSLTVLAVGTARGGDPASLAAVTATLYGTSTLLDPRQQLAFLGVEPALLSAVVDWRAAGGADDAAASGPTGQQREGGPDPRVVIWSLLREGTAPDASSSREAEALLQQMGEQLRAPSATAKQAPAGGGGSAAAAQLSAEVGAAVLPGSCFPAPSPRQCLQLLVGLALLRAPAPPVLAVRALAERAGRYAAGAVPGGQQEGGPAGVAAELGPAQLSLLLLWSRSQLQHEYAVQALVGELARMAEGSGGGSGGSSDGGGGNMGGSSAAVGQQQQLYPPAAESARVLLAAAVLCEVVRGLVAEGEGEAVIRQRVGAAVRGLRGRVEALEGEAADGGECDGGVAAAATRKHIATGRQLLAGLRVDEWNPAAVARSATAAVRAGVVACRDGTAASAASPGGAASVCGDSSAASSPRALRTWSARSAPGSAHSAHSGHSPRYMETDQDRTRMRKALTYLVQKHAHEAQQTAGGGGGGGSGPASPQPLYSPGSPSPFAAAAAAAAAAANGPPRRRRRSSDTASAGTGAGGGGGGGGAARSTVPSLRARPSAEQDAARWAAQTRALATRVSVYLAMESPAAARVARAATGWRARWGRGVGGARSGMWVWVFAGIVQIRYCGDMCM